MTRAQNGERDPLERPMTRRRLQTELATTDQSQATIAKKYGVSQPALSKFKKRHLAVIEEIRNNIADEFAGIEIANKANRLEMYNQLLVEALDRGDTADQQLAVKIARQVAEELGHLPGRVTLSGEIGATTNYKIEGVNMEDLK
jgi:predicted transcriptional regulator